MNKPFGCIILTTLLTIFLGLSTHGQTLNVVSGSPQNPTTTSSFDLILSDPSNFNRVCDPYGNCYNNYQTSISSGGTTYYLSNGVPYIDGWNDLVSQMGEAVAPPVNALFDISVTDSYTGGSWSCTGCFITSDLEIDAVTSSTVSCSSQQANLSVTVSGGVEPYSYSWSNGATTMVTSVASAGSYSVTVTDAIGATVSGNVTAGEYASTVGSTADRCGTVEVNVVSPSGVPPYSYLWSNGATTNVVSGLEVGTYSVTITDNDGCIATASATVAGTQPTLNVLTGGVQNAGTTSSFGMTLSDPTGGVSFNRLTDEYGNWLNNYQVRISDCDTDYYTGTTGSSSDVYLSVGMNEQTAPLANDMLDVTVYDSYTGGSWFCRDCFKTSDLTVTVVGTDISCAGDAGSATATITGGAQPVSISWTNGDTTATASISAVGNYSVTVTDANNVSRIVSVNIGSEAPQLTTTGSTVSSDCQASSVDVDIASGTGTPPFSYLWSSGQASDQVSGLSPGTYTVTVTDNAGCVSNASAEVVYLPTVEVVSGGSQHIVTTNSFALTLSDPTTGQPFNRVMDPYGTVYNAYQIEITDCNTTYYTGSVPQYSLSYWNGILNTTMTQVAQPPAHTSLSVSVYDSYTSGSWSCSGCITFFEPNEWSGNTSTDWNDASNWWSGSVPGPTDNVTIGVGSHYPHISTSAPGTFCGDLTIASGASLVVNAGKAFNVSGDLSNEGTIIVKADATGIGSLITGGAISGAGSFQMEQYLTGAGGATPNGLFYYVSSPVTGATASTFDLASGNKLWGADEINQNYPQITGGSVPLNVAQGYVARMGATGVVTFSGNGFNTGGQSASGLTRTGSTELNRGYNLVGNPYPSSVLWDGAIRTNLESTLWFRTHQGSTMLYDTYNAVGGIGTNNNGSGAVTGEIPPTQAFWVRVDSDGATGQLGFDNTMRTHGLLSGIYRMEQEDGTIRMELSDGNVSDEQIILFNAGASDNYDDYDSHKFWASNVPQLYSNVETDTLTINGLNSPLTTPTVNLGVKIPNQGDHTLTATAINFTETGVYLEDRMLGVFQDLNVEPSYAFTSVAGNIATRFALHFNMSVTDVKESLGGADVYAYGSRITVSLHGSDAGTVNVFDVTGRMVHSQHLASDRTVIDLDAVPGIYVVHVETSSHTMTRKLTIQ